LAVALIVPRVLGAFGTVVGALLLAVPNAGAGQQPAISVSPSPVDVGGTIRVTGSGFPPRSIVMAQLCGRNAVDGSSDCDVTGGQMVADTADGTFVTDLPVSLPPVPCPCVVWVSDTAKSVDVQQPITVNGAPGPQSGPVATPRTSTGLKIEHVSIAGGGWRSWFGLSDPRSVVVVVRNVGTAPYDKLELLITEGRGKDPSGFVRIPPVQRLDPGRTATVRARVDLGTAAFGNYTVKVRAGSDVHAPVRRSQTTVWPWGLIVIALLVVQLVLLATRNVARRRIAAREQAAATDAHAHSVTDVPPTDATVATNGVGLPHISWSVDPVEEESTAPAS
jgi:hypothetical protein